MKTPIIVIALAFRLLSYCRRSDLINCAPNYVQFFYARACVRESQWTSIELWKTNEFRQRPHCESFHRRNASWISMGYTAPFPTKVD